MIMVATVNGNGPFYPAIVFKGKRFVQGRDPFDDMGEALRHAQRVLEALRDAERSPGFDQILASLP